MNMIITLIVLLFGLGIGDCMPGDIAMHEDMSWNIAPSYNTVSCDVVYDYDETMRIDNARSVSWTEATLDNGVVTVTVRHYERGAPFPESIVTYEQVIMGVPVIE